VLTCPRSLLWPLLLKHAKHLTCWTKAQTSFAIL
jgi:hypothetical protein